MRAVHSGRFNAAFFRAELLAGSSDSSVSFTVDGVPRGFLVPADATFWDVRFSDGERVTTIDVSALRPRITRLTVNLPHYDHNAQGLTFQSGDAIEQIDLCQTAVESSTNLVGLLEDVWTPTSIKRDNTYPLVLYPSPTWDNDVFGEGPTAVDAYKVHAEGNLLSTFYGCSSLTSLDVSSWDVSNAEELGDIFNRCSSLTSLDVSSWDVSNAIYIYGVFSDCSSLTSLDVSSWDVSNAEELSGVFSGCSSLTSLDVSSWDVSNVIYITNLFSFCSSLTSLDVSSWDVSNAEEIGGMFFECPSLTSLDLSSWVASNVTYLMAMFEGCSSLTSLDLSGFDVSNVTCFDTMFAGCTSLTSLNLSGWDMSNADSFFRVFEYDEQMGCPALTTVIGPIYGIKQDLSLSQSPLTRDSALVFINGLYDYAAEGNTATHTLTLSSTTKALLTSSDIDMAMAKGWAIV